MVIPVFGYSLSQIAYPNIKSSSDRPRYQEGTHRCPATSTNRTSAIHRDRHRNRIKKSCQKCRLCEKCTTAHISVPAVVTDTSATITADLNTPIPTDYSSNQIGTNIAAAIPGALATTTSAPPNASPSGYTTTQPEVLYSLLTAATPTIINGTTNPWETAPNPADYSLADIEEVIARIRKRHGRTGTPVPELMQENTEALR